MIVSFSLYQLLVPLLSLIIILRAFSRFFRQQLSVRELIVWLLVWVSVALVAIFPDVAVDWLARVTGIKSGINALIFFALVVLMYGYLRLFVRFEENEKKLTELVRKMALEQIQRDKEVNKV